MREHLLLTALLIIVYAFTAFGRLTTTPLNQYAFVGWLNQTMRCSSTLGSGSITWVFTPVGKSMNVTVASGSTVDPAFTQLYWIEQPTADESNLIIQKPNDSTAGTFTCADKETFGQAQLIILHNIGQSTNASDNLDIGDIIRYTCQLVYLEKPFFLPIFYLKRFPPSEEIDNTTSLQFEKSNSLTTATATFYQIASCLSFLSMQCEVKFGQPEGNLLPGSATNAPKSIPFTVFPAVNVSCFPSIIGAVSEDTLYFGAILTCQLIVDRPVNYSWTDLTYGNSIIGPQLTVWQSGSYQCMASINSDGSWSTSEKTVYNLTIENLPSTAKSIVYETDLPSTAKSIVYETDLASTAKSIAYETDLPSTARPVYGPIAGGTNVTLTLENWSTQIANISAAYLGGILKATELQQSDRLSNSVVMTTPVAAETLIGQPLPITIEFAPGPYNITTNLSFTYKDNPEITGISPSTFIFTGGQTVNVTGIQLSSVANPFIQVTIVVERGIGKNTTSERSFQPCEVKAGSELTCRMPAVNIPDDFQQVLNSQFNYTNPMSHLNSENPLQLSRRKRYANALNLTGPNGVDILLIKLGFILDGYKKYDNINDDLPDTQILIFSPPEISFAKDIIEFDPDKDEFISIKGKYMTRGCRLVHYVVKVGADVCENIDLTDNQLRCRPPKQQPQSTRNGSINCDQLLSINIDVGFMTYRYACMKYSSRLPVLLIGLVVGLSSFVVIILLIIAIVFYCKRSRNSRPANNTLEDRNTSAVNEAYEPPSDQLHANDGYLQLSSKSYASETYIHPADQLNAKEKSEPPSDHLYAVYLRPSSVQSLYANDEY